MDNNIDSEIFDLMFQIWKNIKVRADSFKEASNITMPQFLALSLIEKKGIIHMKEIAEYFSIEMPTATSLLNKLARLSLINRATDKADRRTVKVTLTRKGEELLTKAKGIQEKNVRKMLSYLSEGQKADMLEILKTLQQKNTEHEK